MHRPQKAEEIDLDDTKPLDIKPLQNLDRMNNPKDIDVDEEAISHGIEHGGTIETRAESLMTRGRGGRKRSQNSAASNKGHAGRDISKKR
ncbi:MAG: hypothetical protein QM831_39195 [Kofleriaceae bacterium]